jgi:UDP-N-acetylglucosamine transferase subunit ALG13
VSDPDALAIPPGKPLVLTVVGTDHHPFDRVVDWMDLWAAEHRAYHCLIQYGTSRRPRVCAGVDYVGHSDLQALMQRAATVVSHGGPGTIMEIRSVGIHPVVVARDPGRGEHVDGHQQRFVELMAARGLVDSVTSSGALAKALDAVLSQPRSSRAHTIDVRGAEAALAFGALVEPLLQRSRRP